MHFSLEDRAIWYSDRSCAWIAGYDEHGIPAVFEARADDLLVLRALDESTSFEDLGRRTGRTAHEAEASVRIWQSRMPRSVLARVDVRDARAAHAALDMLDEICAVQRSRRLGRNNVDYHRHSIARADTHFDDVEITVSHAYSAPHPALQGRTYGAAFFDRCLALGAIGRTPRILEIGCGTGRFAKAFLDRFSSSAKTSYEAAKYTLFDVSPTLAASQRELCRSHASKVAFLSGDAECYRFREPCDLVIANEVIGDLSVGVFGTGPSEDGSARAMVGKYDLDLSGALDRTLINVGAIRLLEEIARILAPAGRTVITEYGALDSFPKAVKLGGHTEHSIHFGHMTQVATALRINAHCEQLTTFLGFDGDHRIIRRTSRHLLSALCQRVMNKRLSAHALDEEALKRELGDVVSFLGNIQFVAIADPTAFMSPSWFQALWLERPG